MDFNKLLKSTDSKNQYIFTKFCVSLGWSSDQIYDSLHKVCGSSVVAKQTIERWSRWQALESVDDQEDNSFLSDVTPTLTPTPAPEKQAPESSSEPPDDVTSDAQIARLGLKRTSSVEGQGESSFEAASTPGKKPRGCKVKYPLSPAQEELVKFYQLIEESLPNPKHYFVGKDIRCFHCNQIYPKVKTWKDHIMNDHYHRAQTCESCGEVFTYTFYLHRRTCMPAGDKEV